MKILRLAALAFLVCILLVPAAIAQTITGSTTIDIDPDTGRVTIICETDLDGDAMAFYEASVTCTEYANGTLIGTKSASDTHGFSGTSAAAFTLTGVPQHTPLPGNTVESLNTSTTNTAIL